MPYICGQLEWEVHLPTLYLDCAICETSSVSWYSIYLCSVGRGVKLTGEVEE